MRYGNITATVVVCILAGCTTVPVHDGLSGVQTDLVVARVKCEMASAVLAKAGQMMPDGSKPYAFLFDWAAKLHFTVIVDNQASINPGATLVRALPPAGATAQTFGLGIGAGITTQAVRQEDYEYLMSFRDLRADRPRENPLYDFCRLPEGQFLESNLGMAALIDTALKPIEQQILYPGNNYGPGALPPVGTNLQPLNAQKQLTEFKDRKTKANSPAMLAIRLFENPDDQQARDIEARAQSIVTNIIKPLYGIATTTGLDSACLAGVTFDQQKATVASVALSGDVIKVYQSADDKKRAAVEVVENDFRNLIDLTNRVTKSYRDCALAGRSPGKPKLYDPIDAIGQTVNFYVTTTGSVTPSWKLVTVTAPLSPTFASATRKDTNTLILSLGRPVLAPDGQPRASDAMNNQVLASLLSQAIAQRAGP